MITSFNIINYSQPIMINIIVVQIYSDNKTYGRSTWAFLHLMISIKNTHAVYKKKYVIFTQEKFNEWYPNLLFHR